RSHCARLSVSLDSLLLHRNRWLLFSRKFASIVGSSKVITMETRVIKTLIVDDERIARQLLREERESLPEVVIVGEAEDGKDALRQIVELQPDLVFLDLQMPVMGGLDVVRNLSGTRLPVVVI